MSSAGFSLYRLPRLRFTAPLLLEILFFPAVLSLIVLAFLVAAPAFPSSQLDSSWAYALDVAALHGIPFGQDLIFTFGPLVSIYTGFFLPQHVLLYYAVSIGLLTAFCTGLFAVAGRRDRVLILVIPFLLANLFLRDGLFISFPVLITLLASSPTQTRLVHAALLTGLVAAVAALPLIKGTTSVPVALGVSGATWILIRRGRPEAVVLPVLCALLLLLYWILLGQPASGLPAYFRHQAEVAAGFTDAMSLFGNPWEPIAYLVATAILLGVQACSHRPFRLVETLVLAGILFVAFKAGFVRHDGHAMIAAGSLALVGLMVALPRAAPAHVVAACCCLAAWVLIDGDSAPVTLAADCKRAWAQMAASRATMVALLRHPQRYRAAFARAKQAIATDVALPPTQGIVDLYEHGQGLLLAADRDYYPRPVPQSYTAYTPHLAFLNKRHLYGPRAPTTVFFNVSPIDGRYPSLDDGASWPDLLSLYRFRTFADDFAVLDRQPLAEAASIDPPAVDRSAAFGEDVAVPPDVELAWASLRFHPTLLGRLTSFLWKLPLLMLDVTYGDGRTAQFRIIAGMSDGFLLSPTVSTAQAFAALRSSMAGLSVDRQVRTFSVHPQSPAWLWGASYDVQLARLHVPVDRDLDDLVLGRLRPGPAVADLPTGGDCAVDTVGGQPLSVQPIPLEGRHVIITGWGIALTDDPYLLATLRIAVTPQGGGQTLYAGVARTRRPDVDAYFDLKEPTRSGFKAEIDVAGLAGRYSLNVVENTSAGPLLCAADPITVTTAP